MKIKSLLLDYTTLANWRRCPTKFSYEQLQGLQPAQKSEALDFGSLIHTGLELLYTSPDAARVTDSSMAELDWLASGGNPHDDCQDGLGRVFNTLALAAAKTRVASLVSTERRSLKHLLTLLTRYVENYFPDVLHPVMLECHHTTKIGEIADTTVNFTGTLDMLEADRVIETKTTSFIGASFLDRTNPNDQATGYCVLSSDLLGKEIRTVVFNGISTSGFGLKSHDGQWPINKEPSKLFLRAETYRTDEMIDDWRRRLLKDASQILANIRDNDFSANAPDACTMFNSLCPYADLCRASSAARPQLINNLYTVEKWRGFKLEEA